MSFCASRTLAVAVLGGPLRSCSVQPWHVQHDGRLLLWYAARVGAPALTGSPTLTATTDRGRRHRACRPSRWTGSRPPVCVRDRSCSVRGEHVQRDPREHVHVVPGQQHQQLQLGHVHVCGGLQQQWRGGHPCLHEYADAVASAARRPRRIGFGRAPLTRACLWLCVRGRGDAVCGVNTYNPVAGSTTCDACPAGSTSSAGATTCACSPGYSTSGSGSTLVCTGTVSGGGVRRRPTKLR